MNAYKKYANMRNSIKIKYYPQLDNNSSNIILERKQSVQTKIFDILWPLKWVVQNRITLLGAATMFFYCYLMIRSAGEEQMSTLYEIGSLMVYISSIAMIGWTSLWIETATKYRRAQKHIIRYWTIREEFFEAATIDDGYVCWYCWMQWIYLAAKEYWIEDHFRKLSKKYSKNIIPNF